MAVDPPILAGIERLELVGGGIPGPLGPVGPTGPVGPAGPMPVPTYNGVQAITTAPITLKGVNEWSVASPVQISLVTVPAGSQHTVHVTSGFQNITWPNGTQVYGETEEQEVWVTLIRTTTGWTVLIPSPGVAGVVDTGWIAVFNAANIGAGLQFTLGDASMVSAGWTLNAVSFGGLSIRRSGNFLLANISGPWFKESGTGTEMFSVPVPTGLVYDSNGSTCLNSATVGGAKVLQAYTYFSDSTRLKFSLTPNVPAGVAVSTQGPLIFPIGAASTWGA